jgi:hypothetical protein
VGQAPIADLPSPGARRLFSLFISYFKYIAHCIVLDSNDAWF